MLILLVSISCQIINMSDEDQKGTVPTIAYNTPKSVFEVNPLRLIRKIENETILAVFELATIIT